MNESAVEKPVAIPPSRMKRANPTAQRKDVTPCEKAGTGAV